MRLVLPETSKMKKLKIDEIKSIASEFVKSNSTLRELSDDERKRLMVGYSVSQRIATVSYYVPSIIAHESRIVVEVSIDVFDGRILDQGDGFTSNNTKSRS